MTTFTPYSGFAGGVFIGVAASILLLLSGSIAGVSGILAGAVTRRDDAGAWRVVFLLGLVLGTLGCRIVTNDSVSISIAAPIPALAVAGLMVGYGTSMSCGCTSGHGICGIARLSPRSVVATMTFMLIAAATVFATHHLLAG